MAQKLRSRVAPNGECSGDSTARRPGTLQDRGTPILFTSNDLHSGPTRSRYDCPRSHLACRFRCGCQEGAPREPLPCKDDEPRRRRARRGLSFQLLAAAAAATTTRMTTPPSRTARPSRMAMTRKTAVRQRTIWWTRPRTSPSPDARRAANLPPKQRRANRPRTTVAISPKRPNKHFDIVTKAPRLRGLLRFGR